MKKRRSTRLNRPTPRTPCGVWGADLVAPLVGNGENGRRRRRSQFRGQTLARVGWLIGLRDPTSFAQTHPPGFPGGMSWHLGQCNAGCPRRLLTKKLTKSYTRYPVVGAWRPRSPFSVTRTSCPRSIHGRSAPDPGLYCAQRLLHSSIALNGRRGYPPFQGLGW